MGKADFLICGAYLPRADIADSGDADGALQRYADAATRQTQPRKTLKTRKQSWPQSYADAEGNRPFEAGPVFRSRSRLLIPSVCPSPPGIAFVPPTLQ